MTKHSLNLLANGGPTMGLRGTFLLTRQRAILTNATTMCNWFGCFCQGNIEPMIYRFVIY